MATTDLEFALAHGDDCAWLRFKGKGAAGVTKQDARRQAATSAWIRAKLFNASDPVPGVLLGDEVGMGKTFEVFGVIAPLLKASGGKARIVVLAHSEGMANTWHERWRAFVASNVDAQIRLPPGVTVGKASDLTAGPLVFASYERVKRVNEDDLCRMLEAAMTRQGLSEVARKQLRYGLFGSTKKAPQPSKKPSAARINEFWTKNYSGSGAFRWKAQTVRRNLGVLVHEVAQKGKTVDLLVVDEAHKLESDQRQTFFRAALDGRARRVLHVTATPFALDTDQLLARIDDMLRATGAKKSEWQRYAALKELLSKFEKALTGNASGAEVNALRPEIQSALGRYLVRSTWKASIWKGKISRRVYRPPLEATSVHGSIEDRAFASLALETSFRRLEGARTHRASYRETLCSSYEAIRQSLERRSEDGVLPPALASLADLLPTQSDSPKLERAALWLAEQAQARQKVVVFCKRLSTISELRKRVHAAVHADLEKDRRASRDVLARQDVRAIVKARADGELWRAWLRHAVHEGRRPNGPDGAKRVVKNLSRRLAGSGTYGSAEDGPALWAGTYGSKRHIQWVRELVGGMGAGGKGHSQEEVLFEFNLPGPPYILLCSQTAKEGIDLHRWCRRVLLYDLEWNPAAMEQQIGRVDRMGSLSRRTPPGGDDCGPVEVNFVWQPRTYEERIQRRVEKRLQMMQVLLGAGRWFEANPDEESELSDLDLAKYRLSFEPPR